MTIYGAALGSVAVGGVAKSWPGQDARFGHLPCVRVFSPANAGTPLSPIPAYLFDGRTIFYSFRGFSDTDFTSMGSGAYDNYIRAWLQALPAKAVVFMSYYHEPESSWTDGPTFAAAQDHFINTVNTTTGVVATVKTCVIFTSNILTFGQAGGSTRDVRTYWPVAHNADHVGFDFDGSVSTTAYPTQYQARMATAKAFALLKKVPWSATEFANLQIAGDTAGTGRAAWIKQLATDFASNGAYSVEYWDDSTSTLTTSAEVSAWTAVVAGGTPTLPKMSTFIDDFSNGNLTLNYYPPATSPQYCSIVAGVANVPASTDGTFKGLETKAHFDATSASLFWQMTAPGLGNCALSLTHEYLQPDGTKLEGRDVRWTIDASANLVKAQIMGSGTLAPYTPDAGTVQFPYDRTQHKWFRIVESAGTLNWFVSADGISWGTAVRSSVTPPELVLSNVKLVFGAYSSVATSPMTMSAINVTPPPPPPVTAGGARFDNVGQADFVVVNPPPSGPGAHFDNVNQNVSSASNPPGAPAGMTASPYNKAAQLRWAPVTVVAGVAPVTSYSVTATSGAFTRRYTVPAPASGALLLDLVSGLLWAFSVVANSAAGPSLASVATAMPAGLEPPTGGLRAIPTVPAAPTLNTVAAGDSALQVTWSPPADNGGDAITRYTVIAVGSSTVTVTTLGTATTALVTGLTNAVAYAVTVTASNSVGASPASSSISQTPVAGATVFVPGPVVGFAASPGNGGALLTWTPGLLGTGAFQSYVITASAPNLPKLTYTTRSQASGQQIAGMTNNVTYAVTIAVVTTVGTSAVSSDIVTPTPTSTTLVSPLQPAAAPAPPSTPPPVPVVQVQLVYNAFPPDSFFTPVNFGKQSTDVRVLK